MDSPAAATLISWLLRPTTASGILLIAVSIPLVFNKIPPNHFYGFRLKKAFESEQNWYAINHYGAKVMIVWSCIMIAAGEMVFRMGLTSPFVEIAPLVVCMAAAIGQTVRFSRQI
ncbi:MAG: SdpI family protein [Desulfatibacillaceae bacterium]|nr:SdpI family protein [Desulfatibacillaceae bacterium]